MARRRPITAGELMEQLSRDPEYQARLKAQEERLARLAAACAADERMLVKAIHAVGYKITSVWDLVSNAPHPFLPRPFIGPYQRAYPILVRHLGLAHHLRIREGIIRALTIKDGGALVEDALLEQFRGEKDRGLRWVLANALKTAMPYRRRGRLPEIAVAFRGGGDA